MLAALVVCLAAALPYVSTIHNYFTADDFGVVQLLAQKPALYFPRWFVSSWMDQIWGFTADEVRPFTAVSYQLTALWGAASPEANHVLNIAFHAANGLLVLAIAQRVAGLSLMASTFAGVAFVLFPLHSEAVAWITGRVDSMPAFFYLAAFLAYARWRARGSSSVRLYSGSLVLYFIALFCKQNTITLPAAVMLFDVMVARRRLRPSWETIWPYLPYVAMTAGYLLLRYHLFGEVARESQLTAEGIGLAETFIVRHLRRSLFGGPVGGSALTWTIVAVGAVGIGWLWRASRRELPRHAVGIVLYFGPVWWLTGVAPVLVAGYENPRHLYLASVGWAIVLGFGLEVLQTIKSPRMRQAVALTLTTALLVVYLVQLRTAVAGWNLAASVSRKAVADLEREALAAPEGTLLIIAAPVRSWEWAVPFVARPPYTRADLTKRAFLVSPWLLHCCRSQWWDDTRKTLGTWSDRPDHPPIVVLQWNSHNGAMSRLADQDYPDLRTLIGILMQTDTLEALDRGILRVTDQLAARP